MADRVEQGRSSRASALALGSIDSAGKIAELLATAIRHHRSGQFADAKHCYKQILTIDPDHADSVHLLGLIAYQSGHHEDALELIGKAIALNDQNSAFHLSLGLVLSALGKLDDATEHLAQTLTRWPGFAEAHSTLANIFQAQGMIDDAVAQYRQAIALKPKYAEAYNNLGNALRLQNKLDEAIVGYQTAIALRPQYPDAHNNLGVALREQGKFDEAVEQLTRALALYPRFAEAYNNLGVTLLHRGQIDEAVTHLEQALALKTDYAEAHYNLGNALQAAGKLDEAIARYRQALALRLEYPAAHYDLGAALRAQGKLEEAVEQLRQTLTLWPDFAEAHDELGSVLRLQGKTDEAVVHYKQALALKPDFAAAYNNLATALREKGNIDGARKAIEEAIKIAPRKALPYLYLFSLDKFVDNDKLAAVESLAGESDRLSASDRIALQFALATAYRNLGDHDRSFHHLLEGNMLKRQQVVYDEEKVFAHFKQTRDTFTAQLMRDKSMLGYPSDLPVFIVGMPRSGTTLIEQILASHPRVFGAGELLNFQECAGKLSINAPADSPLNAGSIEQDQLWYLGESYIRSIRHLAPSVDRITDKLPANFLQVGLIHLALPYARIIHVRRDPIDTCFSCFSLLFSGEQPFTYDLAELGRFYAAYEAMMEHWRKVLPEGVMLEVQYEDMTISLEDNARRIVAHCGLEWDDACLSFHETQRLVRTASATQVRQPIYRSSVGRWRSYEHVLGPLIEALRVDLEGTL